MQDAPAASQQPGVRGIIFTDLTKSNDTICNQEPQPKTICQSANVRSLVGNWKMRTTCQRLAQFLKQAQDSLISFMQKRRLITTQIWGSVSYLEFLSCMCTFVVGLGLQSTANSSQGGFSSTTAQHSFSQAGVCLSLTSTPALQRAAANAHRFEGFGKTGFHYHVYFMRYIVYSDEGFW